MFAPGARVVFLHAHPDDETLATGALIAALIEDGHRVAVLTATRGERGEVVPGPLSSLVGADLVARRESELVGALTELGAPEQAWLGQGPARAVGLAPRRYQDSGMRWITDAAAGPALDAAASSLSLASVAEASADLAAYLDWFAADVLISYDAFGGYGHPDHVACSQIAQVAASTSGVDLLEVVSEPLLPQPSAVWLDGRDREPQVRAALAHYATQLSLDGDQVVHVGGQRQAFPLGCWLRSVSPRPVASRR